MSPQDWYAVFIGIACGLAAGIPTSILFLVFLANRDAMRQRHYQQRLRQQDQEQAPALPFIYIVDEQPPRPLELTAGDYRALAAEYGGGTKCLTS